ncbi:GNAT family N-acetyltransferase [Rummeliibacillus pycnus]|uniref:GNAT family N-acetyltransferase n=1 Tax=Rummeliibacillus pycnus TaxID=101070 RepID=UPI003D2DCAB8
MEISISRATDFSILAQFLCGININENQHIGYCGEKNEEILQSLEEDFIDQHGKKTFLIVEDLDGVKAAIGFDIDEESASAEVWGPFVKSDLNSQQISMELWHEIKKIYPSIHTFNFFINEQNKGVLSFMKEINATQTGKHLVLQIEREKFIPLKKFKSNLFQISDFESFANIHNKAFPNAYYGANTILNRINEQQELRILKDDKGNVQGYAYFEVTPGYGEASIEFIAVSSRFQNQGLGTILLKEVLTRIFMYESIDKIQLCVAITNDQANHVYHKAGFYTKHQLLSYSYIDGTI